MLRRARACAPTTTAPVLQTERPVTRREVATAGVAVVSGPQRHLAQCRREGLGAPTRTARRATAAARQAEAGFVGTVGVQPLRQCAPHDVERHPPGHRLDRIELNTDRRTGTDQRLRLGAELRRDARCEPRMMTQSGRTSLPQGGGATAGPRVPNGKALGKPMSRPLSRAPSRGDGARAAHVDRETQWARGDRDCFRRASPGESAARPQRAPRQQSTENNRTVAAGAVRLRAFTVSVWKE